MKWHGKSTKGVSKGFLNKVATAASARGAKAIYVISGLRTKATNTGVSNSNHLPDPSGHGHAIDGYAIMADGSKVPLGTLLKGVAGNYGLRSGDVAGFYNGQPDPNHVDDGYNVGGVAPVVPGQTPADVASTGTVSEQGNVVTPPATDQLSSAVNSITQLPGPPTVTPALAGDFQDYSVVPRQVGETWQLIAAQGNVSQDTIRLAQMASYGGNGTSASGQ